MAIPDYETVMLPLMIVIGDGRVRRLRDVIEE